ncbi:MAG: DUF1611 domain-containing protein [Pseudomonadota bacterium]
MSHPAHPRSNNDAAEAHSAVSSAIIDRRALTAKRAFVTRNVDLEDSALLVDTGEPRAGDIILARVTQLGQHRRLESPDGRRVRLFVDDDIVVAYGNRYATDQFEAVVPDTMAPCRLVAAGGIAATLASRSTAVRLPTQIEPLGFLCRADRSRLNVMDYAPRTTVATSAEPIRTCVVVGSGMNTGKTTTVANLVRGARLSGQRVAAVKVTGTGAGGDLWHYLDAGAHCALDFTDAGYASTAGLAVDQIVGIADTLLNRARALADIAFIEIADGLFQRETRAVLEQSDLLRRANQVVFATGDPMAAEAGVRLLSQHGIEPVAISGAITQSKLACLEAERATGVPTQHNVDLAAGRLQSLDTQSAWARYA